MPDLNDWLRQFGLESLAGVLAANDLDLDILPDLTEHDFEKLGISLGQRRRLLRAIASLNDSSDTGAGEASREPPKSAPGATLHSEAERRQVTVLFSDIVGSTALATALDPEDLSRLIKHYQDACAAAITRFDGYIAKFMGDGVLAYFGYPRAHEDAAERSAHAALAIVDAVRQIAGPDNRALETRIGIATGLVVVGDIVGAGAAREEAIVGETPNLAARLQSLAEPNSVLVSEATYRLLGRRFESESRGEQPLKGFAKPVPVWRLLREASLASRFAATRGSALGPFIGREQEMGLLLDRWRMAQQGEGQAILLTAEPGMGKSRLVEALFERLGETPHRRVTMQCSPHNSNTAFYPVMRQVELDAGFVLNDPIHQKLEKLDALLAKAGTPPVPAAPLFAELLSLPADNRYPKLELAQAQHKSATISALIDHILRPSQRTPVLFVLEDVHWIDPTTLEFLTQLIDSVAAAHALVIVTARPEFASPWSGRDHVMSLALGRLGKAQCVEIVASIAATQSMNAELMDEILARTDGVPLFVEELTRTLAETDAPSPLAVPATLQDSLMARLDRLGPAKEIAQIAATIGRQFARALLAAVAPMSDGELDLALARLMQASLVFPQARAMEPTYSFKHALTRDVAYDSLLRTRRQQLHARIAHILEDHFPALAEAEPEILAHHFGRADLPARASIYCERAGDHALARSAYAEAVAHFNAALAEAARLPPGRDREQRELGVLLKLGPALLVARGWQNPEIEQGYHRAHQIATALGDERSLFKAAWGLWFCAVRQHRTATARDRADELVVLAERSNDEMLRVEAIHCRWSTAFFRGDVARTVADGREGIKHYNPERHSGLSSEFGGHDPGVCAATVIGLGLAQLGRNREAVENVKQSLELAKSLHHPNSMAFALMNAMTTYQVIGDRGAVRRLAQQAIEVSGKFNLPPQHSIAVFMLAWATACGDELEAGLHAMEAEYGRVSTLGPIPQFYAGLLASVRLEARQTAQALGLLNSLPKAEEAGVGFFLPEIHRLRGECLVGLGTADYDAAIHEFNAAIATAKRQQARVFQLRAAMGLAHAWQAAGSPERAIAPLRETIDLFATEDDTPNLEPARQALAALTQ